MCFVLCLVTLFSAQAMTTTHKPHHTHEHHTHAPHVTKEPTETEHIKFYYDNNTHQMLLVIHHSCYVFALSDAERIAVHTDIGIRTLELKLLNVLDTGTQTPADMNTLDRHVQYACGNVQHIFTVA